MKISTRKETNNANGSKIWPVSSFHSRYMRQCFTVVVSRYRTTEISMPWCTRPVFT